MQEILSFIKFLATSNTINFILMLMILAWIIKKVNVGKSFDDSISQVALSIKKSDDEKSRADNSLAAAKAQLEKLPADINKLENNSKKKIAIFEQQIEDDAQNVISKLNKNIDRAISIEAGKLSNVITDKTSLASIEYARQSIINHLRNNPDLHNKFIQDSLGELDKVEL